MTFLDLLRLYGGAVFTCLVSGFIMLVIGFWAGKKEGYRQGYYAAERRFRKPGDKRFNLKVIDLHRGEKRFKFRKESLYPRSTSSPRSATRKDAK